MWLQERVRLGRFKKVLFVEVEINLAECLSILTWLNQQAQSGGLGRAKISPFPFKRVVFEAFREDLRFFNRDLLQKTLIFYSRLDEANRWRNLGTGPTRDKLLLDAFQKAVKEGDALRESLKDS